MWVFRTGRNACARSVADAKNRILSVYGWEPLGYRGGYQMAELVGKISGSHGI